jgi:hypothetical protein
MAASCFVCGDQVEQHDAYCPSCGASLGVVATWPTSPAADDAAFVPVAVDGSALHAPTWGTESFAIESKLASWWYAIRLRWWRFLWRHTARE